MRTNVFYLVHTETGEFYATTEPMYSHIGKILYFVGMKSLQLSGEYAQPHDINVHGECVVEKLPHPRSVVIERFDHFTGQDNE